MNSDFPVSRNSICPDRGPLAVGSAWSHPVEGESGLYADTTFQIACDGTLKRPLRLRAARGKTPAPCCISTTSPTGSAPRLLLDHASVALPDGAEGRPRRPQRHRQDHAVPADPRRAAARDRLDQRCPGTPASARSRRKRRGRRRALIETVLAADTRARRRCSPRPRRRPTRTASPKSRRGSPTSTPIRPRRARPRSSPASASTPRRSSGPCSSLLRRLAHARGAGRGAVRRARPAAARRADQLSRPRRHALAGELRRALSAHRAPHQPRPRPAQPRGRRDRPSRPAASSRSIAAATTSSSGSAASSRHCSSRCRRSRRTSARTCRPSSSASATRRPRRARRSRGSRRWPGWSRSPRSSTTRSTRSAFPSRRSTLAPPIVAMEGVAVGYEPGQPVLNRLDLRIDDDDRIALLGANGNGKSTFAKLLAGRLDAVGRHDPRARKLEVAYFAQHQLDELDPAQSRLRPRPRADAGRDRGAGPRPRRRGSASPTAKMDTPARDLSGGEKARLLIGLATFAGAHLLDPRRADQPSRHRQPRGAGPGAQRLSRARSSSSATTAI